MTEETESKGGDIVRRHKLPWRSEGNHVMLSLVIIIVRQELHYVGFGVTIRKMAINTYRLKQVSWPTGQES